VFVHLWLIALGATLVAHVDREENRESIPLEVAAHDGAR
jgi:hypothetical protein